MPQSDPRGAAARPSSLGNLFPGGGPQVATATLDDAFFTATDGLPSMLWGNDERNGQP